MASKFDRVKQIAQTRAVQSAIVDEFGLREWFRAKNDDEVFSRFTQAVDVSEKGSTSTARITVTLHGTPQGQTYIRWGVEPERDARARELSARVANRLTEAVQTWFREHRTSDEQTRCDVLEESVAEHKKTLDEAMIRLAEFERTHDAVALEEEAKKVIEGMAELTARVSGARASADAADAQAATLMGDLSAQDRERVQQRMSTIEPRILDIQGKLSEARTKLAEEQTGKGKKDTHPDVIGIRKRIDDLTEQLHELEVKPMVEETVTSAANPVHDALVEETAKAKALGASWRAQQTALDAHVGALRARLEQLPGIGRDYAGLSAEVELESAVVKLLSSELEIARVESKKQQEVFTVVDEATPPARKAGPSLTRAGAVVLVLAVILGVWTGILVGTPRYLRSRTP
jgi:uncharacterized protein involved in exopolysaccharide biosynthesis